MLELNIDDLANEVKKASDKQLGLIMGVVLAEMTLRFGLDGMKKAVMASYAFADAIEGISLRQTAGEDA